MRIDIQQPQPTACAAIDQATIASGFTMASDSQTCSLLGQPLRFKAGGSFPGTGHGYGFEHVLILDGMDKNATLISVDNAPEFLAIARQGLGADSRLTLVESDGAAWIEQNSHEKFDYIFADTWHGKYLMLDEVLGMLNPGGFYILDDMLPSPIGPMGTRKRPYAFSKPSKPAKTFY